MKDIRTVYYSGSLLLKVLVIFGVVGGGTGLFGFAFGTMLGSSAVVNPGQKAVKVSGGQYQGVVGPGIHLGVPFLDRYRVFDMRQNVLTRSVEQENQLKAIAKDDIKVKISATIRWDIKDGKDLADIYKNVAKSQDRLVEKIVAPSVESTLETCATTRPSEELVSDNRQGYKECVYDNLNGQFKKEGLIVYSVNIIDADYPRPVAEQFEAEKKAEQEKRIARKKGEAEVIRAEKEGQAKVIRAQKQAEAIVKVRENLTGDYIQYYAIKEGMNDAEKIYVVPSDGAAPDLSSEIVASGEGEGDE